MTNPPVMEGADMEVNDLHISKKAKTSHDYAQEKLVFPLEFAAEEALKTKCVLLNGTDSEKTRKEIREYFHKTFTIYEQLFEQTLVNDESYFMQGTPLRHPLIFYYGHTAAFFVNKAMVAGIITERIDPHIEFTCAIGVDEMSWDDLNPAHYQWPTVAEVREYRVKVRALIDDLIMSKDLQLPITWESPFWVVLMGIEHERIHLETSSVLFRQLPVTAVKPSALFAPCPHTETPAKIKEDNAHATAARAAELRAAGKHIVNGVDVTVEEPLAYAAPEAASPVTVRAESSDEDLASTRAEWALPADLTQWAREAPLPVLKSVPAGDVQLGKPFSHGLYGWDNEYGSLTAPVAEFKAATTLVSNRQFLAFMAADGYHHRRYWTAEGWAFAQFRIQQQKPHPEFWVPQRDSAGALTGYRYRLMGEEREMPWEWPVDLNCLESKAYANWLREATGRPIRMPSEAEWYRLREHCVEVFGGVPSASVDQPNWDVAPGNINLEHWSSSCPTDYFDFMRSGFHDVIGNVWQNCETPIQPFPGFKVHPAYDDFTVPTFDNLHAMIKGGSWISTGNEACLHARYAFRRHFYQHAGVRVVESDIVLPDLERGKHVVADDHTVSNPLHDHYFDLLEKPDRLVGAKEAPYPVQLAHAYAGIAESAGVPVKEVLYGGCSVGRGVFELARNAQHVLGLDFTTRVIRAGTELSQDGTFSFMVPDEGSLGSYYKLDTSKITLACAAIREVSNRVEFVQGDMCNLAHDKFTEYDVVIVEGLEQRNFPARALRNMAQRVKEGGLLLVGFTGAWDESITAREHWLGGYKHEQTGETLYVRDVITSELGAQGWTPVAVPETHREVACVQRQGKRVYQTKIVEIIAFKKA